MGLIARQVGLPSRLTGRSLALVLIAMGGLLLATSGSYYIYSLRARAELGALVVGASPSSAANFAPPSIPLKPSPQQTQPGASPQPAVAPLAKESTETQYGNKSTLEEKPSLAPDIFGAPQPGETLDPRFWAAPLWGEEVEEERLAVAYHPVNQETLAPVGTLPAPTRLRIPLLGVDSSVSGLRILDLGSHREYETPDSVVGHIPESANPGERGNIWMFGHLESPIRNEGSVFRDLPRVPGLLRQGYKIYTIVDSPGGSFLYQVTSTNVLHKDDLQITGSDKPSLTLVTCIPRFLYDHRLVVIGELVGKQP
jgi:LPXTG-site transpeptidase (sortase) family protein